MMHFVYDNVSREKIINGWNEGFEENNSGDVTRDSSDLDLGEQEWVAVRFTDVTVPQGATVTLAYVELCADDSDTPNTDLTIFGQDADDAPAFSSSDDDISDRSRTSASVTWENLSHWTSDQWYQTPDIASIIEQIVSRSGWASGNALVIMLRSDSPSGERDAITHDQSSSRAPKLHIEYNLGGEEESEETDGTFTVRWVEDL